MQIQSLSQMYEATFNPDVERKEKRSQPRAGESRGDTVSFSEEALSLARSHAARRSLENGDSAGDADNKKKQENNFAAASDRGDGVVLNGAWASEKDLYAEIQKTQEDVDALSSALQAIMNGEGSIDEKIRLSEPTRKQLTDKLETLSSLKSAAEAIKMNKQASAEKTPLTGGV